MSALEGLTDMPNPEPASSLTIVSGSTETQTMPLRQPLLLQRHMVDRRLLTLAAASIVIALLVMALKYVAFQITGSVALFSDAAESIVNVITATVALWAIWLSSKPADAQHPFGHSKAEYFSAVLEGVLIVVAALVILHEAYGAFFNPRTLNAPIQGMALNGIATLINAAWSALLISFGRRLRSPALEADGRHILSDVVTSVGVLVGVGLVQLSGNLLLDPLIGALVALYILWSGWRVVSDSVDSLMDRAVDARTELKIRETLSREAAGAIEVHDLRTRGAGRIIFIDFHLVVPTSLSVGEAHVICDRLENALHENIKNCSVTIHVEPEGEAQHKGVVIV
jgi:cation diffusion facilitator family transporter